MSDHTTCGWPALTDAELDGIERFYQAKREGECEDALTLCANLRYARGQIDRWRHIVMDILQADEGGQGLPYAEAMDRANKALKA